MDIGRVYSAFKVDDPSHVKYAGTGDFMNILHSLFNDVKENLTPVDGLQGVYTVNPEPPVSPTSLQITEVSPPV